MEASSRISAFVSVMLMYLTLMSCQREQLPAQFKELAGQLPEEVSYNFHIKPILSDRCFVCHGPDESKREADLRLDLPASALDPNREHRAIVARAGSKSEVVRRILSLDHADVMPPPESKLELQEMEKAMIIKWINQGAVYEDHWAFLPETSEMSSDAVAIDALLDPSIAEQALQRAPLASRQELIRRASFDLTGLPPTWSEVEQFVHDNSEGAYERLLDRLLQKKAYGERMAADWLDVARYADSDGYLDDKHRKFYPWRDWVIEAFNNNMPYDQFATWQIAGDLLPNATQESILATAFNRLHRKNSEAGIVFEEYRVEYVADRLHTFGKAFLGLTIECARCHDHKYDPISQKEYYELFAFFNQTDEIGTAIYGPGQTPGPSLLLANDEQKKIIGYLENKIGEYEELIDGPDRDAGPLTISEQTIKASYHEKLEAHHNFDAVDGNQIPNLAGGSSATLIGSGLNKGLKGNSFFVDDYNYVKLGKRIGWYDRFDPFSVSLWIKPKTHHEEAGIFSHCEDLRLGYKGYSMHLQKNKLRFIIAHSWPYNCIEVTSKAAINAGEWTHVAVTYDGSSRAAGIKLFINGKEEQNDVINDHLYKGILYEPDIHTYGFHGFRVGYRDKIKNMKGGGLDELKIFDAQLSPLEIAYDFHLIDTVEFVVDAHTKESHRAHQKINTQSESNTFYAALKDLRDSLNQLITPIQEIMVMGDCRESRPTYVLDRGVYSNRGDTVKAQTPSSLSPPFTSFEGNRLGLARWLFDKKNSLTARVMVNRIWQQHFGAGLVRTPEDFGAQGALPSHPQLLDYLATFFREENWDIKKLHKHIMMSAAYRRTHRVDSLIIAKDPENKFMARGPRQRLSAEMIRDNALAVSGLLVNTVGGPSVYPYQPEGLWDEISNKSWRYPYLQKPGDGLYRRSIYTIWKRTSPPPAMLLFDSPDRSFCTVQREQTSTPLQALNLLNDPQYLEASRTLALKVQGLTTDSIEQLRQIARFIWNREPLDEELNQLQLFYLQELKHMQNNLYKEQEYLSAGTLNHAEKIEKGITAALARTAHSLFNSFEAQVK